MNRAISVFGLGYVGTVTAACFAHKGHNVIGVDLSPGKVEAMAAGRSPIVEPRVERLISEAHAAKLLSATSSSESAVLNSDISFLCVGTPSLRNGKLDLGHIEPVCREIGPISEMWSKCACETKIAAAVFMSATLKPSLWLRGARSK